MNTKALTVAVMIGGIWLSSLTAVVVKNSVNTSQPAQNIKTDDSCPQSGAVLSLLVGGNPDHWKRSSDPNVWSYQMDFGEMYFGGHSSILKGIDPKKGTVWGSQVGYIPPEKSVRPGRNDQSGPGAGLISYTCNL